MMATATETLTAPVPSAVLSLTSSKPSEPFAAVCKTTDNTTTTDVIPLLLPSSETKSTAAPSRGRSTSPRARDGRPPSPRRSPRSPSRSPSPQRSGTAVRAAAVGASSWSAAAGPAASRLGGHFSSAAAVKNRASSVAVGFGNFHPVVDWAEPSTAVRAAAVDASSWSAAAGPAASRLGGHFSSAAAVKASLHLPRCLDHDLNVRGGMAAFEHMMKYFILMLEIQEEFFKKEKK
ncbi:hypothetical protein Esi_0179_0040 [Ectocarpus siliculosus]|uniref:Uncharacterized protein n=1 Tax=Ectocarpus siliculosus TaxID=2880 RepID=D7FND9_ECTSI|nr:hypothetical protein Esi_0179_0040 [Ectocarpus siliculosus]|eukprot:CBJ30193.1 hypothetical protein Esi_0179_0040 [Ectocarpus siliculosus]